MTKFLTAALAASFLMIGTSGLATAAPIDNGDGSQTCNASGPSGGTTPGVCANDLKTNEGFCEGGMSTEPGGGTTCSEPRSRQGQQAVKPAPLKKPAK